MGCLDEGIEVLSRTLGHSGSQAIPDGRILFPLMPNSIGEEIQRKHKLTPINLSYVVPILRDNGIIRAFKYRKFAYH
jgi:hypothetical protein